MIKTDQFALVNEAAIDQFAYFAKLSLSNLEKFTELGLGAAREADPGDAMRSPGRRPRRMKSSPQLAAVEP